MQAVDQRDLARAEAASAGFDAELWRISNRLKDEANQKANDKDKKKEDDNAGPPKLHIMPDALPDPLVSELSVMSLELRAGVLVAKKQNDDAKKLYAQAAREAKAMGYREPPTFIQPVGETEGAAFLAASDWTDAKTAYKEALADRPRAGLPLYGIAMASEQAGDVAEATANYESFLKEWKSADADLPQLAHARSYLAAHEKSVPSQ
jgi:hypothetical protein